MRAATKRELIAGVVGRVNWPTCARCLRPVDAYQVLDEGRDWAHVEAKCHGQVDGKMRYPKLEHMGWILYRHPTEPMASANRISFWFSQMVFFIPTADDDQGGRLYSK